MKDLQIETKQMLYIKLDDQFYIEGDQNGWFIDWYICNNRYGVKKLIFGVEKEFDIRKYIKENYYDILELYYPYMDIEGIEGVENDL